MIQPSFTPWEVTEKRVDRLVANLLCWIYDGDATQIGLAQMYVLIENPKITFDLKEAIFSRGIHLMFPFGNELRLPANRLVPHERHRPLRANPTLSISI